MDIFRNYITFSETITEDSITSSIASGYITPPLIAGVYGFPSSTGSGVKVGIISLGGGFLQSDLNSVFTDLYNGGSSPEVPSATAPTINLVSIDGANTTFTGSGSDQENTLDIYCIATLVPNATITLYVAPNSNQGFIDAVAKAVSDNVDVISISWGSSEFPFTGPYSSIYAFGPFLDSVFASAVAKGITICCSSGDTGNESGSNPFEGPQYPASSQYVIAVGGTLLSIVSGARNYEYPTIYSGGGVSAMIPVPGWQSGLTTTSYPGNTTSALTGRGVPDMSAPFHNYAMYFNGGLAGIGGTSAACPVIAAMIARYIAINSGKRPIQGAMTINARAYANISAFYNSGYNYVYDGVTGLTTNDQFDTAVGGYLSSAGSWNPVTGLGSPIATSVQTLYTNSFSYFLANTPNPIQIVYSGTTKAASTVGGETLTVNGRNFVTGMTITVNGTLINPTTYVSTTQFTFTSPAMPPGSWPVIVTYPGGYSSNFNIIYSTPPVWITSTGSIGTFLPGQVVSYALSLYEPPVTSMIFSITSGSLPTGINLDINQGILVGTIPSSTSTTTTSNFTITATNSNNQATSLALSMTIAGTVQSPQVYYWANPTLGANIQLYQNFATSITLNALSYKGDTITYTSNALPTGLTLSSGVISGTPTGIGNVTTLLTATSSTSNTVTNTVYFNVAAEFGSWTYPISGQTITMYQSTSGQIGPFSITTTRPGDTYVMSVSTTLPTGLTFNSTTNTISGSATNTGITSVTLVATSALSSATSTISFNISVVPAVTGWVTPLSGSTITTGAGGAQLIQGLTLTTTDGNAGPALHATFSNGSDVPIYTDPTNSLPSGLSISSPVGGVSYITGALTGVTLTSGQSYAIIPVNIKATGSVTGANSSINFNLQVYWEFINGWTTPTNGSTVTTDGAGAYIRQNIPITAITLVPGLATTADTITFLLYGNQLPTGLSLVNGQITGTPTVAGTFKNIILVAYSSIASPSYITFNITVNPTYYLKSWVNPTQGQSITTDGIGNTISAGVAINQIIVNPGFDTGTTGTMATYETYTASGLPPGLVLGSHTYTNTVPYFSITGTPTTPGTYGSGKILVTNTQTKATSTVTFSMTVQQEYPLTWTTPTTGSTLTTDGAGALICQGGAITAIPLTPTYNYGPVGTQTFSIAGGSLPTGLSISGNTIVGTPSTIVTNQSVSIKVTDSTTNQVSYPHQFYITTQTLFNGWTSPTGTITKDGTNNSGNTLQQGFSVQNNIVVHANTYNSNYPFTYTVTNLPAGLTFDGTNISGTPTVTTAGTSVIFAANYGTMSFKQTLSMVITPMFASPTWSPSYGSTITLDGSGNPITHGTAMSALTFTFSFTNSSASNFNETITYTAVQLPAGLTLTKVNNFSCYISGTPTSAYSNKTINIVASSINVTSTGVFYMTVA